MIPGTVVLLGSPPSGLVEALESVDLAVLEVPIDGSVDDGTPAGLQRQLTAVAVAVRAANPAGPLLLLTVVAGPQLPAIGRALLLAGHRIGGYLFVDAALPGAAEAGRLDPVQIGDWPDAPCGYARMTAGRLAEAKSARLRGWPVIEPEVARTPGAAVATLIGLL